MTTDEAVLIVNEPVTTAGASPAWLETRLGERIAINGVCSIGRAKSNMLVIPSERVSRRHALLHREGEGEYLLVDLGSSNGTFVNGRRVDHTEVLHDGDLIEIGPKRLVFHDGTDVDKIHELFAEDTGGSEAVACWLLVASTENANLSKYEEPVDDRYKTLSGWPTRCAQIADSFGGLMARQSAEDIFVYWPGDVGQIDVTQNVLESLRRLEALQARNGQQFRVTLHHGKVLIDPSKPNAQQSLEGTGVTLAFHLQRLAWMLSVPCLLSKAAAAGLSPLWKAEPLALGDPALNRQPLFAFRS